MEGGGRVNWSWYVKWKNINLKRSIQCKYEYRQNIKNEKTANVWSNGKNTFIKGKIWKSEDVTKEQNTHEERVGRKQQIGPKSLESILCSSMPHTCSLVSMLCCMLTNALLDSTEESLAQKSAAWICTDINLQIPLSTSQTMLKIYKFHIRI